MIKAYMKIKKSVHIVMDEATAFWLACYVQSPFKQNESLVERGYRKELFESIQKARKE